MRARLSCVVCGCLGVLAAQTAYPPSRPLLRIETGMHTADIRRIDVDAAERFVVTASHDKTARIWDLKSGNLLKVVRPPQGEGDEGRLEAVAISPDGATLAVGGWTSVTGLDNSIYLFDRTTGSLTGRFSGLPNVILHLSYSRDGRYLVASLWGKNGIRVYRTADAREVGRDTEYGDHSYWAEFDRTGRVVTTSFDGFVRLYSPEFRLMTKQQARGGRRAFSAGFSPDGGKVAVGFEDSTTMNVLSGSDLSFLYAPDTARANNGNLGKVAWSADGRVLYAGGRVSDHS